MQATCCSRRPSAGTHKSHKLASLRSRLQRLAAAAEPARAAEVAAAASQQQQFVSDEERRTLSPRQQEFVERKRKAGAGLGPIMPQSCTCTRCQGNGTVQCHCCGGSGVNASDKAEELFTDERGLVVQNNGLFDSAWFFKQNAPCWLCRGSGAIGCPECSGSGMSGLADFTAD